MDALLSQMRQAAAPLDDAMLPKNCRMGVIINASYYKMVKMILRGKCIVSKAPGAERFKISYSLYGRLMNCAIAHLFERRIIN